MKKVSLLFVMLLCTVLTACSAGLSETPQPERAIGKKTISASYIRTSSYAKIVKESDLVAEVQITIYWGDLPEEDYWYSTLYEAKILTCYKNATGRDLSEIKLVQTGNSEATLDGYPLFQTGDRLLLALTTSEKAVPWMEDRPDYFFINGDSQTAMQIVSSEDGDACFTYLPSLTDLPKDDLTPLMRASASEALEHKYTIPEGEEEPVGGAGGSCSNYVSRAAMEEWFEEVLKEQAE